MTKAVSTETSARRAGANPSPVWLSKVSVRAKGVCSMTALMPFAITDPRGMAGDVSNYGVIICRTYRVPAT